jgi:hypothetical protein
LQASILVDADLAFSAAAGPLGMERSGKRLTQEAMQAGLAANFNSEASQKYFFNEVFGGAFVSVPAKIALQPNVQYLFFKPCL